MAQPCRYGRHSMSLLGDVALSVAHVVVSMWSGGGVVIGIDVLVLNAESGLLVEEHVRGV